MDYFTNMDVQLNKRKTDLYKNIMDFYPQKCKFYLYFSKYLISKITIVLQLYVRLLLSG
jgi:hypothetical protein